MKLLLLCIIATALAAAHARPFTPLDLQTYEKVSNAVVSPDGVYYAITVAHWDQATNKKTVILTVQNVPQQPITAKNIGKFDEIKDASNPIWSADSKTIFYLSGKSGKSQLWAINIVDQKPYQVTNFPVDIANLKLSQDRTKLLFSALIYPSMSMEETAKKDLEVSQSKVSAQKFEKLMIRRWDDWWLGKNNHVFVSTVTKTGSTYTLTNVVDVMKGVDADCPSKPFGGSEEFDISPDNKEVAITTQIGRDIAWSTDLNIYLISLDDLKLRCMTCENAAVDTQPLYSPDGKYIAYLKMVTPKLESERSRITIYNRQTTEKRVLTEDWQSSPAELQWGNNMKTIYCTVSSIGNKQIFAVDVYSGNPSVLVADHFNTGFSIVPCSTHTKQCLLYSRSTFTSTLNIYMSNFDGSNVVQLTTYNDAKFKDVEMSKPIRFIHKGADGADILTWAFKPQGFVEGKKYPLLVLIHGGPEDCWVDQFHNRWNPQAFTGNGYAVIMPNFHGSVGFGDDFQTSILGNWGGKPYTDIMMSVEAAINEFKWIDGDNVAAAGASYGSFMINWINSQTNRFKCLVAHDGVFDPRSRYYYTDELYFVETEFGAAPFEDESVYTKWSPALNVATMNTPELIIHGGRDYRIPEVSGFSTFTALQRRGIESILVRFPNENHWVTNPNNAIYWHNTIFEWVDKHVK